MPSQGEKKKSKCKPALKLSRKSYKDRKRDLRVNYCSTGIQNQTSLAEVFIDTSNRKPIATLFSAAATEEVWGITKDINIHSELQGE